MADVTVMEGQANGFVPPAEPKKRGRPSNASRQAAKEAEAPAGPEPVDTSLDDSGDFWIHILNLSPDEWNLRLAYLIRLAPTIEKRSGGKPASIATYACPFDRDKIMKEHGSGVYRIDFLIQNQHTGKYTRYRQVRFDIFNMDYPPNVPYGEWIDRPDNESWKWAGPKLLAREAAEAAAAGTAMPRTNGGVPMYPPGFNIKDMYDSAFAMAKQMTPAPLPAKDDTVLITLLTELIKNRPEPQKPDDTATKALLSFLEKQNDRLAAEIKELRNQPAAAQGNILTQVKELRPVLTEFVEIFAAKNGGEQPWWAAPLEKLMEGVGEAIPSVVDMMKNNQGQQQRQQQPNPWQQNQGLPAPQAQPQQQPQAQQPQATAAAPLVVEVQPEMSDLQKAAQKWGMFILQIAPQMATNFAADEDGHGGYHFRDWVIRMHGLLAWSGLKREVGPQMLFDMVTQHPKLSADLSPEPERIRFIQEFFTAEDEEQLDEEDDQPIDLGGADAA